MTRKDSKKTNKELQMESHDCSHHKGTQYIKEICHHVYVFTDVVGIYKAEYQKQLTNFYNLE